MNMATNAIKFVQACGYLLNFFRRYKTAIILFIIPYTGSNINILDVITA